MSEHFLSHFITQVFSALALVAAALALKRASNAVEEAVDDGALSGCLRGAHAVACGLIAVTAATLIAQALLLVVTKWQCSNTQPLDWTYFLVHLMVSSLKRRASCSYTARAEYFLFRARA